VGQNVGRRKLVSLAQQLGFFVCTGRVDGDIPATPTYRATTRTAGTRPDHIVISHSLSHFLCFTRVGTELRGFDHFPLTAKLSLDAQISQVSVNSGDAIMAIKWQDRYRVPFIESLEQARDRLQTPALLAQEGQLADALQSFVQLLLACADNVGMSLRPKGTSSKGNGNRRINQPFFDSECQRLKREWRKAGRLQGFQSPATKTLERHYHSIVRSRKRAWLLSQLQDCIRLFHACPRQFGSLFEGGCRDCLDHL
jgi:hypothetical protein